MANSLTNQLGFRLARDSVYALLSRLAPKLASMLLFVLLMRYVGASEAGTYSLSVAFLTSGILLSSFGLEELVVRDVARDSALSRHYLTNMLFLRGLLALLGYGVIAITVGLLRYDAHVRRIVLLQCLGLFPEGLNATLFAAFSASRRLRWTAIVAACSSAFQLVAGGIALWAGVSLEVLVAIVLGGSLLGLTVAALLSRRLLRAQQAVSSEERGARGPDWAFCRRQLMTVVPFMLITVLVSIDLQLDIILLSTMWDVAEVGIYGAARTIVMALALLPRTYRIAVYPAMARVSRSSETALRQVYGQSWWFMSMLGLPLTVWGVLASRHIISAVYGAVSVRTASSLGVLMVYLLVNFLYIPGTRLMVVSSRQTRLSAYLGASLLLHLLVGLLLIPSSGAVGTAVARAISAVLYFGVVELYVSWRVLPRHGGFRAVLKPLAATAVMALAVWSCRQQSIYVLALAGGLSYSVALLVFTRRRILGPYAGQSQPGSGH